MYKKSILILVIFFFFTGCSGEGGGFFWGEEDTEIRVGDGVEFTFNIDDSWIETGEVGYSFSIENSGKDPVTISRDNLDIGTVERTQDGNSYITQDSIDSFYDTVLDGESSIELYHGQSIEGATGSLQIKDKVLEEKGQENFRYFVELTYPYTTEFNNNVLIDLSSSNLLTIQNRVSQAAPVEVTDISLSPTRDDYYYLRFLIENTGPSYSSDHIEINNFNAEFRDSSLTDCRVEGEGGEDLGDSIDDLYLSYYRTNVYYTCRVNLAQLDEDEAIDSQITGSFDYDYELRIEDSIRIP